ncbi:hypothetical protein COLO4_08838 [Corchorus olitorius]|uniref:Uncharacterized protein n=1 Tax=Corchorus olitorius TaxID=93759 RepID=A0A1R3KEC0_9ROSI|nr:hypothetical protein COLO4_08838 [Corchorus olitorius]
MGLPSTDLKPSRFLMGVGSKETWVYFLYPSREKGWLRADEVMTWQCKQLTWPSNLAILLNSQVRFIPPFALTF